MNWFTLYLLTLVPSLKDSLGLFAFLCGIATVSVGCACIPLLIEEEWALLKTARGYAKRAAITCAALSIMYTVLPSRENLMFIVGGSTLIDIAQTDRAKGIADKSLKVVEKWLADQTAETEKK